MKSDVELRMAFFYDSYRKELFFQIREKGKTSGQRIRVEGLRDPNYSAWNSSSQQFEEASLDAIHNNQLLKDIRAEYEDALKYSPCSAKELRRMVEKGVINKGSLTLGAYFQELIDEMKSGKDGRLPSNNYGNYIATLNKLREEGGIINVRLSRVSDEEYIRFSKFLKLIHSKTGRSNYAKHMARFKHVINVAREERLTDQVLSYNYRKHAPCKAYQERTVLTIEQYANFEELNLSRVSIKGREFARPKLELYHDFAMFLYEMKMRPCDLIRLHWDDVKVERCRGKKISVICYVPEKKKNNNSRKKVVANLLTAKALEIMDKYKGMSKAGYIFPFKINECRWDYNNGKSWQRWSNRSKHLLEKINKFLKEVATLIGVEAGKFTLYSLRHSVITHELQSNNKSPLIIATEAGTSAKMLDEHYFDIMAVYRGQA